MEALARPDTPDRNAVESRHAGASRPFQAFLDEHRAAVLGYLRSMVGPVDADDCFQETFVAALRAWDGRGEGGSRSWVMRIAHNKAIDHQRARARRPEPRAELPEPVAAGEPLGAERGEGTLWAAVARLPDGQRSAVALRFVGELSYREIGAALACSEQAARRRVADALARLRDEIDSREAR